MNYLQQLQPPQLVSAIGALGVDHIPTFGGTFEGGYLIQQNPKEFSEFLLALKDKVFGRYLQIGIAAGGSERLICEYFGIKSMCIIDDGKHPNFAQWPINRQALMNSGVQIREYVGNSHSPEAVTFLSDLSVTFELIGIDGDHTDAGVLQDWKAIQPFAHPGTLVWFHDTADRLLPPELRGPHRLWKKLRREHKVVFETDTHCGIGVLEL